MAQRNGAEQCPVDLRVALRHPQDWGVNGEPVILKLLCLFFPQEVKSVLER